MVSQGKPWGVGLFLKQGHRLDFTSLLGLFMGYNFALNFILNYGRSDRHIFCTRWYIPTLLYTISVWLCDAVCLIFTKLQYYRSVVWVTVILICVLTAPQQRRQFHWTHNNQTHIQPRTKRRRFCMNLVTAQGNQTSKSQKESRFLQTEALKRL